MSDFIPTQNVPSDYGSLPDSNTSEAILYGPSYSWIKSALWVWDEMEDYLINKADQLERQLMDREWSCWVMRRNPSLILARSPPVNEVDHLKDLFTLRQLCKTVAGIQKLNEYRQQNIAYARMKGVQQYVKGMEGRGISESQWKAATADFNNSPITYDYVHGLTPDMMPGDDFDWNDAFRDLMGGKDYDRMVERIFGVDVSDDGEDGWGEGPGPFAAEDAVEATEEEQSAVPSEEETGPPSPEPVKGGDDGLADALNIMFDDPVGDAEVLLESLMDECFVAALFWEDSDTDNRAVIDSLINWAVAE